MGIGDAILTSATIRKAHALHPDRPICVGPGTRAIWDDVWQGLPVSKEVKPGAVWIHDYGKHRPYIDYDKSDPAHFHYRPEFKAEPGWIVLSEDEKAWARNAVAEPFIYIEPNVKGSFGGNKDWGFERWQAVVNALPEIRFVQGMGKKLNGVTQVQTPTFRKALGLLESASAFVGTDGALHHAAAALAKPAVVVWGGLASPKNLGYDSHINLWSGTKPCGSHVKCPHCRQALDAIKVEKVVDAIRELVAVESA